MSALNLVGTLFILCPKEGGDKKNSHKKFLKKIPLNRHPVGRVAPIS